MLGPPTVDGLYISPMNLIVSHTLSSDVLLDSDWILPCLPVFVGECSLTFIDNLGPSIRCCPRTPPPMTGNR